MTYKKEGPNKGNPETLSLYAVGDVCVNREKPESIFALTAPIINGADIAFCQLETTFSERGTLLPQARSPKRAHPRNASALKYAGFDVVSAAGNHCIDYGADALFDTLDILKQQGLLVLGVGKNITEARKPVIIEKKGTRVAFLAYNSILPLGYWAEADRPGCVPLRGWTFYEQIEHDQPGTRCRIHSFAHREDLEAMKEDIKNVRSKADIVVVSLHWGLHFVRALLADYQREIGHVAIDTGADLILGHHAHLLKGIEVYKGKVIFYSLGNFAFDSPRSASVFENPTPRFKEVLELNPDWKYDPDYSPTYGFPPDSRKTLLVKCAISNKEIRRVSFLPAFVNKHAQPEILPRDNSKFDEVLNYMRDISRDQGLNVKYSIEGDEVLIST